jgi:carboxymethylenebutenolidase
MVLGERNPAVVPRCCSFVAMNNSPAKMRQDLSQSWLLERIDPIGNSRHSHPDPGSWNAISSSTEKNPMMDDMKRLALFICLVLAAPRLFAASQPTPVSFPSGNETVHGLLYLPAAPGPHPAIIVIHEWWGLNDWIKEQSANLASQGYVALAVDLYRGKVATDPETAHELMRGLPQDRGVRVLVAAADYLKGLKRVNPNRIGAVGWCMGGSFAAQFAVVDPDLRAVAINYGSLPSDPAALKQIHAAFLGNFGALDQGITPQDVNDFAAAMRSLGKPVDVKIYPDAGHAFENPNNKGGYRPADAKDAQERMTVFFRDRLLK